MSTLKENTDLPYAFDLLFDIKDHEQLMREITYLRDRLNSIYDACRRHEISLEDIGNTNDHQK